ncbi:hypothetical protein NQ315_002729 [Exocentrus adspersus]|uniref:Uncharacterized protein n=1 Tax=Exocentrus adspersus TaxID=1586481 RepID=A0AAV8V8W4_9CUCU|nr:hypothetical protein NQ315_002729 [Exocentrus adspersus]
MQIRMRKFRKMLMMIGYGEQVRRQAEVAILFSENHPELPPISQGTVSKIYAQYRDLDHVRDVERQRQPRINEEDKLNVLLKYQEQPVTPARKMLQNDLIPALIALFPNEVDDDLIDERLWF